MIRPQARQLHSLKRPLLSLRLVLSHSQLRCCSYPLHCRQRVPLPDVLRILEVYVFQFFSAQLIIYSHDVYLAFCDVRP